MGVDVDVSYVRDVSDERSNCSIYIDVSGLEDFCCENRPIFIWEMYIIVTEQLGSKITDLITLSRCNKYDLRWYCKVDR